VSLDGSVLIILLALVTAAAFAAVVLLWRRLSGRGWKPLLGRVAALAGAQLALVGLLAAASNDYFGFYSSWHDLFGLASQTLEHHRQSAASGGLGAQAAGEHAGQPGRGLLTVQSTGGLTLPGGTVPSSTGETQDVTIYGRSTGLSTQAIVYLPPQYFRSAFRRYRFPVAIVSSGYPGDLAALEDRLRYPYRLLAGVDSGRDRPIVLVMTQPSPASVDGVDTECTNVPGGPQVGTFWAQDIPAAIERAYPRVTRAASGWGAIGDSTGGDCALKVAMMNSDRITVAVSLSGDYNAPQDITTGDIYGTPEFRELNNVMWRAQYLPKPPISVLLASSRSGESDYRAVLRFQRLTEGTPTHTSTLIRNEGGHNFTTWNAEIPPALQWLTTTLRSPTPLPTASAS
jgi:hypothetical protein